MGITKHIPNSITCCNLLCGCLSIISALESNFQLAFILIIIAAVFDFFDGFAARLLKAYSPMGKELDSLADMVSFGVAPAFILFSYMQDISSGFITYIPLLVAVFSGLRLAQFNIDERQTENFIGLATPSCALLSGSLIYFIYENPTATEFVGNNIYILPIISVILSLLLVSEINMFSFKFKSFNWDANKERFIFLILVAILGILVLIFKQNWSLWIMSIFTLYILINIFTFVINKLKIK